MMAPLRRPLHVLTLTALALPMLTTLMGCGDESRTDGTQVVESPQTKAMIEDMRKTYEQQKKVKAKAKANVK